MKLLQKTLYIILIVLTIFLALTTIAGGLALMANIISMPVSLLQGSVFGSYTIPGLALAVLVGGGAVFAAVLLLRRSRFGLLFATTAGVMIMFFEFVEMLVIGSPAGIARTLQVFYFSLGTLIVVASMGSWFLDLVEEPGK